MLLVDVGGGGDGWGLDSNAKAIGLRLVGSAGGAGNCGLVARGVEDVCKVR